MGSETVLWITQSIGPQIFLKLVSFILTCRGGSFGVHASSWWSHKSQICWDQTPLEHICVLFQDQPKKYIKKSNLQQKSTITSKHYMFRYGLIHVQASQLQLYLILEINSLQQTLQLQYELLSELIRSSKILNSTAPFVPSWQLLPKSPTRFIRRPCRIYTGSGLHGLVITPRLLPTSTANIAIYSNL